MQLPRFFGPQFAGNARTTVRTAVGIAREAHSDRVRGVHLLIALADSDGSAAAAMSACGVPVAQLRPAALGVDRSRDDNPAGLSQSDVAALAEFGIDADAILDALGDPAAGRPEGEVPDAARSGLPRFRGLSSDARAALLLAARRAKDSDAGSITENDILLGVLDSDPETVRVLQTWSVTRDDVARAIAAAGGRQ